MGTRGVAKSGRSGAPSPRRRNVRLLAVGLAVALALVVVTSLLSVRVDGVSMTPTFANGERVLLRPFSGGDRPARFDVVVTRFTENGPTVIKRVIGLPGDGVRIDTSGGAPRVEVQPGGQGEWLVVINPAWEGQWGTAPLPCCRADGNAGGQTGPQVVPAGMLFLLGDHPAASEDSRTFGWAPIGLIDGVVARRLRLAVYPAGLHNPVSFAPR